VPLLVAAALITIRIYNYAAVPPAELADAHATADRIFHEAGIQLEWMTCRMPTSLEGDACATPLRSNGEFVVRLQASSNPNIAAHAALGSSLLDVRNGGGVLITIDPRMVRTVAANAMVDPSIVLGRAVAHELGHLLMGTAEHSPQGLMRELWSQLELRQNKAADWCFLADQVAIMRNGLTRELGN